MKLRSLGKSGLAASVIGFGGGPIGGGRWGEVDEGEATAAIHACLEAGVNLFDTAPVYGLGASETLLGKALAGRRHQALIATKCGLVWSLDRGEPFHVKFSGKTVYRYLGPESIRYEVEQSLRRLQTDYIDLYQTHWQDATTPIAATMETLLALQREGKIRAIGVSNCSVEQLEAYRALGPIASAQEKYNMLERARGADVVPYCRRNGVAVLAYMPLAAGLLTCKVDATRVFPAGDLRARNPLFAPEVRKAVQAILGELRPIAEHHQVSYGQLAIAWTISQPGVTHALVGVRNPRQAGENAHAGSVALSAAELHQFDEALARHAIAAA